MIKLFQKLTKKLSIKSIVILGVFIMGLLITAFALTMIYLSSTIKYDQTTLRNVLKLEKLNQNILNITKNIAYLDNKILTSTSNTDLQKLELDLLKEQNIKFNIESKQKIIYEKNYSSKLNSVVDNLNKRITLQNEIYDSKGIILFYELELGLYKAKIDNLINSITNESESIYGLASLISKRYNRDIKRLNTKADVSLNIKFSKVMTLSKDLDSSILKLPTFIHNINTSKNVDLINTISKNNLSQLVLLVEDSLLKLSQLQDLNTNFKTNTSSINSKFLEIRDLITFLIVSKKQLLKEEKKIKKLILKSDNLNDEVFNGLKELTEISSNIKLNILSHSDSISKKTTSTILVVGVISLVLIALAATTLISRINLPLELIMKFIDKIVNSQKSLSSKLPIFTDDEFGRLSQSFNNMTSTISNNIGEIKHLNKEIEDTQKEVIFTMGAIGETRSKETGNHVKRVAEYSRILALKYGLDQDIANLLKEASPMHDIGKVGIPDSVLKKPATLDSEEWQVMKTHAELGYDMLKHSNRNILKAAAIVAHEHHEKWDGSGYPRGLIGEHIHIYGRITAVADVFDALGSDRCYKKAWPLEEIKNFFIENRSKHFDPKLVDIFLENLDEFLYVRDKYKDVFD